MVQAKEDKDAGQPGEPLARRLRADHGLDRLTGPQVLGGGFAHGVAQGHENHLKVSLAFMRAAVHPVPLRSTPGRRAARRPRSAGPVGAAYAGVHGLAQVLADDAVGFGDPGQRPADGLAHRDPGALGLVGEGPGPAAEPGRA